MRDHHTEQRQQWLREMQKPTTEEALWDIVAALLGATLIIFMLIAGG